MTLIQRLIFEALSGHAQLAELVGSRVYPDVAPQDIGRVPYVVWQEISETQANDLNGSAETGGLNNYRVQITSWAGKGTLAREVDAKVRLAMIAASGFKSLLQDSRAMPYEPETKQHGKQSDFSVWLKT